MADADKAEAAQSPSAYVGQPEASAGASAGAWGGAPGPAHLQRQVSDTGDGRNFSSFLKAGDMDSRGVGMMSAPTAMRLQVNEGIRMKGEAKAKAGGGEGEGRRTGMPAPARRKGCGGGLPKTETGARLDICIDSS